MGTPISGKPAADTLDGTEIVPGRQGVNDVKITTAQIATLAGGGGGGGDTNPRAYAVDSVAGALAVKTDPDLNAFASWSPPPEVFASGANVLNGTSIAVLDLEDADPALAAYLVLWATNLDGTETWRGVAEFEEDIAALRPLLFAEVTESNRTGTDLVMVDVNDNFTLETTAGGFFLSGFYWSITLE